MINFYQLQILAPLALIYGVYSSINAFYCCLLSIFVIGSCFYLPFKVNRVFIFFIVGCFRGLFLEQNIQCSYSYTSFQANVVDYQIREKKSYLLLKNFKYISRKSVYYNLDEFSTFPVEALMEVEDVSLYKDADLIEGVGRFYLPMSMIGSKGVFKQRGVLKYGKVLKCRKSHLKRYLRDKFYKCLSCETADFCCAVFLGDTFAIKKDMRALFENAGLAHVLGVSILNLYVILLILFYFFYYLIGFLYLDITNYAPLSIWANLGSLSFVGIYCYFIGFDYPLMRALFMSIISLFLLFYSKVNQLESLFLSACLLILIDPFAIYDLSFQLSFGGLLGIFAFSYIKFNRWIYSALWTTFSSMSIIGPVSIFQFQHMCLQPFLSNVLMLPIISFVLTPLILLFIFLPDFFGSFLAIFINFLFNFMLKMVVFLSKYAKNMHFLPVFYHFFITFFVLFLCFSIIKERIRYLFLGLSYAIFCVGLFKAYCRKPFLLVSPSCVGLVLKDRIWVYPKCCAGSDFWSEYYNLPSFDGAKSGLFKLDNGKVVVYGIGIIRKPPVGQYCLKTDVDYVFLPSELMDETQIVEINQI